MRQRAQLGDRLPYVRLDLVDHRHRVRWVVLDGVLGEPQLDREGDEMLLRAVVQVPLELAPLGIAGRDDAGAGVLQLLVASLQFVEAGLQGGIQLQVVQRKCHLPRQLGEDVVLAVGECLTVTRAGDNDAAEQLSGVGDRGDPCRCRSAGSDELRQPHVEPRATADSGAGDDRQFLGADGDRLGMAMGDACCQLVVPGMTGPHLG